MTKTFCDKCGNEINDKAECVEVRLGNDWPIDLCRGCYQKTSDFIKQRELELE